MTEHRIDLFVHELAFQWGGAEKVFAALADTSPTSPVAVLAGDSDVLEQHLPGREQRILFPELGSNLAARAAAPLVARRLPRVRLEEQRIVISSYALGRWLPAPDPRLVYCHAPMRQIWHGADQYRRGISPEALALRTLGPWLRRLDQGAGHPDDYVIVPSPRIADLVARTLDIRVRGVVPPPVPEALFSRQIDSPEDYLIWVGRIVEPVKRLGMLLESFAAPGSPRLLVVGDGRSVGRLRRRATPNVEFVGWQTGNALWDLVGKARALVLPSMEDFGIVAAEAWSLGTPVILTPEAGVSAWLEADVNGWLADPSVESIRRAVDASGRSRPDGHRVRASANPFRRNTFRDAVEVATAELWPG